MGGENIEITGTPSERFLNGAKFGVAMALLLSLYVLLLRAVQGNEPFEKLGVTVPAVIIAYLAGFTLAGGAIGLLWPIRRTRPGAGVLAALGAFIVYTAVGVPMFGSPFEWGLGQWLGTLFIAAIWFGLISTVFFTPPPTVVGSPPASRLRSVWPKRRRPPET
jgi:hypothetical protein